MIQVVIFDLDGTLADISHRLHMLEPDDGKIDWDVFNAACIDDKPKEDMMNLFHMCEEFCEMFIVTGRSEKIREETEAWLLKYEIDYDKLFMRPELNRESDCIVKERILKEQIWPLPDHKVVLVVEDRDRVVKMWRDNGLTCLQCQEGDY